MTNKKMLNNIAPKKYWNEWLKCLGISIDISIVRISITFVFITFVIQLYPDKIVHLAISLPKYGLTLTNSKKYIFSDFKDKGDLQYDTVFFFYKVRVYKDIYFYVMHIVGTNSVAIEVEWEEDYF